MVRVSFEITQEEKTFLDSHPEINNSGLIRKLLDEYIKTFKTNGE